MLERLVFSMHYVEEVRPNNANKSSIFDTNVIHNLVLIIYHIAFYGEVSGNIKINGHDKSIKEISDSIGFVPQASVIHRVIAFILHVLNVFVQYSTRLRMILSLPSLP